MLLVQEYLKDHTFGDLAREHGVYASFSKSGHKWSLNYDQIEAKESDPLAQECRGLVLACKDGHSLTSQAIEVNGKLSYDAICPGDTYILAFPMKRFFNHGQGSAANVNWSDPGLTILEKLDGTLCIMYWDPFAIKWCVATRSVPEADLLMDNGLFTFRGLFEKALKDTTGMDFQDFTKEFSQNYTYCFELTTPYNRIVVNYPDNRITLLAIRSLITLQEVEIHKFAHGHNLPEVPMAQAYKYSSIDELVSWISSLNPMEHEGVVVRDSNFNRIKVKNAAYVAYNKVRDALATSPRNRVELVLAEKDDDVIPMLPEEIVKNLQKIKIGLVHAIREHDEWYQSITDTLKVAGKTDKKNFALAVQEMSKQQLGHLWQAPFFQMFDGKASNMRDFIQKNRKDGTWGSSFLDKMLELSKNYSA